MTQETKFFALQGGLNIVSPAIQIRPGYAIGGVNYEPVEKGYRRVDGFERFDGHPKPSEATYYVIQFDAGVATIAEGNTVTGATSGATGEALIAMVVESGSFGGSDAAGYLVLFNVTGTFQDNENLQVAAVTKCVANGLAVNRGAETDANDTTWIRDAIETTRGDISTVPGSGRIRGVWVFDGDKYCFRDNVGATACVMYKATTAGWVAQSLGRTIDFTSGGVTEIVEGNTITGAVSAATAVVERVILTSGSWAAGDASGRMILSGQTGTFQAENLNVGASLNLATIAGNSSAITLPAGGRYEFVNHNFYGATNLRRMYGVNGVGTAFEWDGSTFVPLITGMATDTPNHIAVFKNHLFLSFPGGSTQHSGTANPYSYTTISGAGELGLGEDVTGYGQDVSRGLVIFGRNKIAILYGNDSTDWVLDVVAEDAGAIEHTVQKIGHLIYMDDRGIRDMRSTQLYGDFKMGSVSQAVEPIFRQKQAAGITATASIRCRTKDQYRLFFSDGTGLTVYLGRQSSRGRPIPEILPFDFDKTVYCACSSEEDDGSEIMLFGSDDGYVYELDAGTSFDGGEVFAYIRLPFNNVGSPTQKKRWHKATLEVDANPSIALGLLAEFAYAASDQPPGQQQQFTVSGGGGFWNVNNWNDFYWSAPVEGRAFCHIAGIGENLSIAVVSEATYEEPHVLHGLILHYSYRGLVR